MGMGVDGVGLATLIAYAFNLTVVTIYCLLRKDLRSSFFWFTRESFDLSELRDYLKIGLPSALMICLDWGSIELLALISSSLGVDATGAQILALNSFLMLIMAPLGG
jgi:multidrug resistance protein, MATE family